MFTWGWTDHPGIPPGSSTVEMRIDGEGSLMTLTHRDLPDDEVVVHTTGWDHYLPRLAAVAEGQEVEIDRGPGG